MAVPFVCVYIYFVPIRSHLSFIFVLALQKVREWLRIQWTDACYHFPGMNVTVSVQYGNRWKLARRTKIEMWIVNGGPRATNSLTASIRMGERFLIITHCYCLRSHILNGGSFGFPLYSISFEPFLFCFWIVLYFFCCCFKYIYSKCEVEDTLWPLRR